MSDITITPATVETPAAPVAGQISADQIDAAVAAAEAAHQAGIRSPEAPAKALKPDYVPEKFWDADKAEVRTEAMAKSYAELEGKQSTPAKVETPVAETAVPEASAEIAAVTSALEAAGISFAAVDAEYQAKGEVSPETRAKLDTAFGKATVDNYFGGLKAQEATSQATYSKTVFDAVGGEAQYAAMATWAAANSTAEDLATFNAVMNGGNAAAAGLAAKGLYASFVENGGVAPKLVTGGKVAEALQGGFRSIEEMGAALTSKEYRDDRGVRAEVDAKVAASTHLMG